MSKYKVKSNLWEAFITGRFNVFFSPDLFYLDFDKKEIRTKAYQESLIEVTGACIIYHEKDISGKRYVDLEVETSGRNILVRCLNIHIAYKLKALIESYIWEKIQKQ